MAKLKFLTGTDINKLPAYSSSTVGQVYFLTDTTSSDTTKWIGKIIYDSPTGRLVMSTNALSAEYAGNDTTPIKDKYLTRLGWEGTSTKVEGYNGNNAMITSITLGDRVLPLAGGTMTGAINLAHNILNKVGNDANFGSHNKAGSIGIKGNNGATTLTFLPYSGNTSQSISIDGNGTMTVTGTLAGTFKGNLTGTASTATNLANAASWAWINGTSAGPTATMVVGGKTTNITAIPSASTSISGVLTTGAQTIAGRKTFNNGVTLADDLIFSDAKNIHWNSGDVRQRLLITDDSTAGTAVFTFQQSTDSGTNYTDLFTIKDDGTIIAKTFVGNVTGNISGSSGSCTGNAATATKLATARKINGTAFDGSADITTEKWGKSRSLSISATAGTTGTSVDGSANATLIIPSTMTGFASITSTKFIGALTGNASSATEFSAAKSITLTGDVTGTASSKAGWSITTTIADNAVTTSKIKNANVTNAKLQYSSMTIAGNSVSLGGTLTADTLRTSLGLSNALHFIGIATVAITDGSTTDPVISGYTTKTAGDVVIDKDKFHEYVWTGTAWEKLGGDSSYKVTQGTVASPSTSGSTIAFIDTISQDANGVITATKKNVREASASQSGVVGIGAQTFAGNKTFSGQVYLTNTSDASSSTGNSGALIIGNASGEHLAIDGNEIMAKSNGTTTGTLYLNNEGGAIQVGGTIQPVSNNTINLGTSSLKYNTVYATTFSGNATNANKVNKALTFGSKTYDGSSAQTITLADLGGQAAGNYKTVQTAVSSPSASGNDISFIDTISQNANGVIAATRKTVRDASASQSGVVNTDAQTFTGVKTFNSGINILAGKDIKTVGTKATTSMIRFIDNTSDANGNGISIGGGGVTIVGAGESAQNLSIAGGSEILYLLSDGRINLEANADTIANRIGAQITNAGNIIPVKAEAANSNAQSLGVSGNRWSKLYVGSADTYGSSTVPVYWNDGVPTAITSYGGNAASASKVNNNLVLKVNTGTTEGTNLYTYNGSAAKTIDFKSGTNVTITAAAGTVTFSSPSLSGGSGAAADTTVVGGVTVSGHAVTVAKKTLTAGTGISITGAADKVTINHSNSVTAGTVSDSGTARTLAFGGTFKIPSITYDAQGHIKSTTTTTITMPANPNVDTKVTQNAITASDYTNWRPLIWGASNSSTEGFTPSTVTDGVYTAQTLSVQPSSGTIRATTFKGSLSGNASTATKLATARTINGTSFDGSANITTANWGTARTLTIGNTGKSVNGSGNVSWSLSEIGAAAASHNHTSLTGVTSIAFSAQSSDSASIKTTIDGTATYFDFMLSDDYSNDQWRWRFTPSGGTIYDAMRLNPTAQGKADLYVGGTKVSLEGHTHNYAGSSSAGGAANSANKLTTARTIALTGSVTGSGIFDGSGNLSIATTTNHNHDDRYYTESEMNTKLNAKLNTSLKGAASGLAELDANGRVPTSQLPSYVDDVIEGYLYNSKFYKESAHTTEITGETGKIYVDLSNNKTYRWSGSAFVVISDTLALGETSSTAYRGDRGKIAYDHSQSTHARTDATAVSFTRSLTSGTKVGTITINGTGTDLYAPTNTDTHWTTGLKVGASATATANAAATNGNVYLNVLDNSTVRDSHKIVGSGATSVTSDANGIITISSTDNNTWRGIQNNLTSDSTTDSLSAAQGKVLKGLIDGKAASGHTHNYAGSSSAGGAANSANKLATARTITLSGAVTGSASFDGSKNITINTTGSQQTLPYSSSTSQLFVTSTANQASYTLTNFVDNAVYSVYVNGFKIPNSEYTVSSSGVVTLTNPPELANQEVEIVADYTSYVTTDSSIYNSSYLNYYRQATAPSNTNALWLDTSSTTNSSSFTPKLYDGSKWSTIGADTSVLDSRYVKKSGDTMSGVIYSNYKSESWVNSLTNSVVTVNDAAGSYGGWICGPTKNGRIAISTYQASDDILYFGYGERGRTTNSFAQTMTWNGATNTLSASKVYGAVWNDYAEFRICPQEFKPGQVVAEVGDDTVVQSTKRLQRGCSIVSDTYGFAIGETDEAKCPLAVSGRVLAYGYEPREEFKSHIGYPVCSGPNGTVSIMTNEEEEKYPSRIIGIISAIPNYEEWGTGKVKVDNRIWIKIK